MSLRCHDHSARQTLDPWDQNTRPRANGASIESQMMTHKDKVHVRTTTCRSRLPGCHNSYPPKHASNKPTQEPSPVLTLWRSSNFSIQLRSSLGGRQRSTLNYWALSPALCRRCKHLQSIHDDTQLPGTCRESPLKCHLWRPCSPPRRFSSGLSLGNRSFPALSGETPY